MSDRSLRPNKPLVWSQTETDLEEYVVVTRAPRPGTMPRPEQHIAATGQATLHTGAGLVLNHQGSYPVNVDIDQAATEGGAVDTRGHQQPAYPVRVARDIDHVVNVLQDPSRRLERDLESRRLTAAALAGVEQSGDMAGNWMPPALDVHRFDGGEEQPGSSTHGSHRRTRRSRGTTSHSSWVHVDHVSHASRGSRHRSA